MKLVQINLNTVKTGEMVYDAFGCAYRFITYDAESHQVIMTIWDGGFDTPILGLRPKKVLMQAKTKKIWYNVWQRKYGVQDLFTVKYYTEEAAKQNNQYYADDWVLIGTHMAEVAV